jgi:hypothetical protein
VRRGDVRGSFVFVFKSAVVAFVLSGSLAACAAGPSDTELPVPTFPASTQQGAGGAAAEDDQGLPDDCERLLAVADLGALLGLPLDSVSVRTIIGTPSPSVGRIERLTCQYVGTPAAPGLRGATLLNVNAGLYTDGAAAAEHWRINVNAEGGGERRDLQLGTAPAVLVQRPDETLLTTVNGPGTVTLVLPSRVPQPSGRAPADTLVDVALRTLVVVTPPPSPTPVPVGEPPAPERGLREAAG